MGTNCACHVTVRASRWAWRRGGEGSCVCAVVQHVAQCELLPRGHTGPSPDVRVGRQFKDILQWDGDLQSWSINEAHAIADATRSAADNRGAVAAAVAG